MIQSPDSDRVLDDLIVRTGDGDRNAFGDLYEQCGSSMYAYALSVLKQPEAARDVVQDAFLRIWRSAPGYVSYGRPMAWILRIVRNLCLDELHRLSSVLPTDCAHPLAEPAQVFEDDVAARVDVQRLLADTLTSEELEIVRLRIYGTLSHTEIADMLGLSTLVVRWKYAYALKKLRRCYPASPHKASV